jgi:hypothetical protein
MQINLPLPYRYALLDRHLFALVFILTTCFSTRCQLALIYQDSINAFLVVPRLEALPQQKQEQSSPLLFEFFHFRYRPWPYRFDV